MSFYSIILPSFNSADTIKSCIESVLNQDFSDFEIVVCDGASTDHTVDIAAGFNDSRIRIFSEPDKGTYDAMNKGIDRAEGKWLFFLGSDDSLYDREVLKRVKFYIDQTDAKFVYGNVMIDGNSNWVKDGTIYRGETPLPVLFECNVSHQCIFYSRQIFTNGIRYNLNYPVYADHDLNLYCASKYKMVYIDLIVALFKNGGASSVVADETFVREKWMNIVRYFKERLLDKDFSNARNGMKKAWKRFLKQGQFDLAFLSLRIYFYHTLRRFK